MQTKNNYFNKILITVAIFAFSTRLLSFFLPLHFDNLGFSGFEIGLFFAVFAFAGILSAFHTGLWNDRLDSRKLMIIGIILFSVYLFTLSLTNSLIIILIAFFLGGLGNRIFSLSSDSYILKNVNKRKGFKLGLYDAIKCFSAATAILIAGYLLIKFNFSKMLLFSALIILIPILIIYFLPKTEVSFQEIKLYVKDILHRRTLIFLSLLFIFTLHWGVETTSYTLFLKNNLNLSTLQMGLFMAPPVFGLGLFAMFIGNKYDKGLSHKNIFLIAFLLSGFGLFMMALFNNPYISFIFRIIHELGDGAFAIFMLVGTSNYFPKARLGGGYGFVMLTVVISQMLGSLIFSPIGQIYGYHIPHLIIGALIFGAGFFVFMFKK
jgi:MFS family permease